MLNVFHNIQANIQSFILGTSMNKCGSEKILEGSVLLKLNSFKEMFH